MVTRRWMMVLMMGMVCALAVSGCKKGPKKGGIGDDNVGPVGPGGEAGMPGHGELSGQEVRGQFTSVYFDYDSAQIKDGERNKMEAVSEYMKKNAANVIVVEGHCDERGSTEYNLALGERRAMAVRAYLVGIGCDGARIQTKSFGEEKPTCAEHNDACWSKNRRGEFVILQ